MSPETTPLHELVESFPTAIANGITAALVLAMLIGGTLFVAHAIRETRAQRYARDLDRRIRDTHAARRHDTRGRRH